VTTNRSEQRAGWASPAAEAAFLRHRERLWGIAYGIVASPDDADDLVQDAYLRWHRTDRAAVRQPKAWLVTTVTRLGIDRLRTRQVERRAYAGPWLPTPLATPAPDRYAEVAAELSVAFLVLLEKLAPEERAAFLLREVFDVSYGDIARALDRTEIACRQVVHRARTRVRAEGTRFRSSPAELEALSTKFAAAVEADDPDSLLALLAPDASYVADGGGRVMAARRVVNGADRVARCVLGVARKHRLGGRMEDRVATINGARGVLTFRNGEPSSATCFAVRDGLISGVYRILNPDKLHGFPPLAVFDASPEGLGRVSSVLATPAPRTAT
jgi:RNA polymerase sigma-70 factor, ECF subfamily